jgi:hypothetical protein
MTDVLDGGTARDLLKQLGKRGLTTSEAIELAKAEALIEIAEAIVMVATVTEYTQKE